MKYDIFSLFFRVSMATLNMQIDVQVESRLGNYDILLLLSECEPHKIKKTCAVLILVSS